MSSSFKNPFIVADLISKTAEAKNSLKTSNLILLSFLAGAYISFGALLAEVATSGMADAGIPLGLEKFVFGAVFPLGLILVVLAGSELFTGNIMYMTIGVLQKTASLKGLLKNWTFTWVFNFAGALLIAFVIAYLGGVMPTDPSALGYIITQKAIAVAESKIAMPIHVAIIKGIGCNWLVCLGLWLAISSDDVIGKIVGVWFPVMAFVTIGFEHSIANMYFLFLGVFLGANVDLYSIFVNNLIPVTVGNIIGGALFVGCIYWYTYLRK